MAGRESRALAVHGFVASAPASGANTNEHKYARMVTGLDVFGNINADLTEITTVVNLKDTPLNKPVVPLTEAIKDTVLHQVDGYSSSISSIIEPNFGTDVNIQEAEPLFSQPDAQRFSVATWKDGGGRAELEDFLKKNLPAKDKTEISEDGRIIFYSQLDENSYVKVVANPTEEGNYRADLTNVSSAYQKGKMPAKLNPLGAAVDRDGLGGVFTSKSTNETIKPIPSTEVNDQFSPRNILIRLIGLISLMKWLVSTHTDCRLRCGLRRNTEDKEARRHGGIVGFLLMIALVFLLLTQFSAPPRLRVRRKQ